MLLLACYAVLLSVVDVEGPARDRKYEAFNVVRCQRVERQSARSSNGDRRRHLGRRLFKPLWDRARHVIGKFCAIATGARFLLSAANHPMPGNTAFPFFIFGGTWLDRTAEFLPQVPSRGDTAIGNDVWIGRDAMIMPGVHVGDGAIVASGSCSCPTYRRTPSPAATGETAEAAVLRRGGHHPARIAWWNWPIDAITKHVREIWTGTPAGLEQTARKAGLLEG